MITAKYVHFQSTTNTINVLIIAAKVKSHNIAIAIIDNTPAASRGSAVYTPQAHRKHVNGCRLASRKLKFFNLLVATSGSPHLQVFVVSTPQ